MDRLDGTAKGKESSHTEKKRRRSLPLDLAHSLRIKGKVPIRVRNIRVGLKR